MIAGLRMHGSLSVSWVALDGGGESLLGKKPCHIPSRVYLYVCILTTC
jgi:hypothetical protein